MTDIVERLREILVAVENGMSHRQAAEIFGVPLRRVQTAVNPARRAMYDSHAYRVDRDPDYRAKRRRMRSRP